ncbi:N-acetylmuramoyl-L-alanine amidase, partial [Listeria monocytogenes]|nr:N-acetylmuramoyl-L-alanine amidase [Listeria monocytogenes]
LLKTDDNNRLVINMDIDTSELHKTKLAKADTKEKTAFNLPLLNVQSIIW